MIVSLLLCFGHSFFFPIAVNEDNLYVNKWADIIVIYKNSVTVTVLEGRVMVRGMDNVR